MTDPFDPASVAPETARFNAELERLLAGLPRPETVPPEVTRAARRAGKGVFPQTGPAEGSEWVKIDRAPGGPGRLRRSPAPGGRPRGTYLHIHGGGWTFGAPDLIDLVCQEMAAAAGCEVLAVEYRLAPEHRWPEPLEDCLAALDWALGNAPGPLVIGGDSAGAHLAVAALVALRDRGLAGQGRIAGAVLSYGMFDLRMTPSMRSWGERYLVLSTPGVAWFVGNLLGGHVDPGDPEVSPLMAGLGGMPPALFEVGTADPLLDDTLFMAARWRAAGGETELSVVPGGVHAFDRFELAIAREARARQADFVRRRLGG